MIHVLRKFFSPFNTVILMASLYFATLIYPDISKSLFNLIGSQQISVLINISNVLAKVLIVMGSIGVLIVVCKVLGDFVVWIMERLYYANWLPSFLDSLLKITIDYLKWTLDTRWFLVGFRIYCYGYVWALAFVLLENSFYSHEKNGFFYILDTLLQYIYKTYHISGFFIVLLTIISMIALYKKRDRIFNSETSSALEKNDIKEGESISETTVKTLSSADEAVDEGPEVDIVDELDSTVEELNAQIHTMMLEEVEDFHEFFMSYDFGEQLRHEEIAVQFRNAMDMLTRSYIHFIRSTLPDSQSMGTDAKGHIDHMFVQKNILERQISYYKREENPDKTD